MAGSDPRLRPYGWGCTWEKTYCFRYGEEEENACLKCHRILTNPDKEQWFEFLQNRLPLPSTKETET